MDRIDLSDPKINTILWAAMCSMVKDIHAPQDNLSESEWALAERVFAFLDKAENERGDV